MRVFKTTYKDKNGKTKKARKWYIELRDHLNIVRRFSGFTDKAQTHALGRQIERLVSSRVAGEQPDAQLTRWLEQIPPKLRDRLTQIGLVDLRRASAGKPLSCHIADYMKSLRARCCHETHLVTVGIRLNKIIEACRFVQWSDIRASVVDEYLADRREAGISHDTSNGYLKTMKAFCNWAVKDGRASESPLRHLKPLRVLKSDVRHERQALEPDEMRRLLEVAKSGPKRFLMTGPERAILYLVAAETGLRRNELRSLKVSSFDFDRCTVTITDAAAKNRTECTLPIRSRTAEAMRDFVKNKLPSAPVFKKITNRTSEMIRADLEDAGIEYVDDAGRHADFHSLRHTTGSLLAASGVHPKIAQQIMRHGDINLTMSRYTHVLRGQESEAIESLPDLFRPSNQNARATGTDDRNLAENLALLGGGRQTALDNNRHSPTGAVAETPISHHEGTLQTHRTVRTGSCRR